MDKEKKVRLATGWLKPSGKFEEVPRNAQQTWAARHLIDVLHDLTHYGNEIEKTLQEAYNYMKFEDGVLMSVVWRNPDMEFTASQENWLNKNMALIDPYTQDFLRELAGE